MLMELVPAAFKFFFSGWCQGGPLYIIYISRYPKAGKVVNIPRAKHKLPETEIFMKPKNCRSASCKTYSLVVAGMCEVWYFSSFFFLKMGKGKWNYRCRRICKEWMDSWKPFSPYTLYTGRERKTPYACQNTLYLLPCHTDYSPPPQQSN